MKRTATALCLLMVCIAICMSLVACEQIEGEVTAEQWQQRVNINLEEKQSFTVTIVKEPLYSKNDASTLRWEKSEKVVKVDMVNGRLEVASYLERWLPSLYEQGGNFVSDKYKDYFYVADNKYCVSSVIDNGDNNIEATISYDKDRYNSLKNSYYRDALYVGVLKYSDFTYDAKSKGYVRELFNGYTETIQFLPDAVRYILIAQETKTTITIKDIDSTELNIPYLA